MEPQGRLAIFPLFSHFWVMTTCEMAKIVILVVHACSPNGSSPSDPRNSPVRETVSLEANWRRLFICLAGDGLDHRGFGQPPRPYYMPL
jgi:hypothetical protein